MHTQSTVPLSERKCLVYLTILDSTLPPSISWDPGPRQYIFGTLNKPKQHYHLPPALLRIYTHARPTIPLCEKKSCILLDHSGQQPIPLPQPISWDIGSYQYLFGTASLTTAPFPIFTATCMHKYTAHFTFVWKKVSYLLDHSRQQARLQAMVGDVDHKGGQALQQHSWPVNTLSCWCEMRACRQQISLPVTDARPVGTQNLTHIIQI